MWFISWQYSINMGKIQLFNPPCSSNVRLRYTYLLVGAVGALTALANKTTESKTLKNIYIVTGIIIGFALKTLSQTLSGVWYWATPFAESLVYNGSYNAVSCLCCIVLAIPLSFNEAIMRRPDEEKAK